MLEHKRNGVRPVAFGRCDDFDVRTEFRETVNVPSRWRTRTVRKVRYLFVIRLHVVRETCNIARLIEEVAPFSSNLGKPTKVKDN